jgi:hypothetical protein
MCILERTVGVDIMRNFAVCVGIVIILLGSVVSVSSAAEEDYWFIKGEEFMHGQTRRQGQDGDGVQESGCNSFDVCVRPSANTRATL